MRDKLVAFIRRKIVVTTGRADRFVLQHAIAGTQGATLLTLAVSGDLEDFANNAADECIEAVTGHIATFTKAQRYSLVAYAGSAVVATHALRMRPDADYPDAEDSDPPTQAGVVGQLMRHNEAMMRIMTSVLQQSMGALAADNESLRATNVKLVKRIERDAELREELTSMAHERDLQTAQVASQEGRKNRLLQHAERFIPVIWDRLSGNDPKIMGILESLDDGQQEKLIEILTDAQKVKLFELMAEREKVKQEITTGQETALAKKEG